MSREDRRTGGAAKTRRAAGMLVVLMLAMSGCASGKYPKLETGAVEAGTESGEVPEPERVVETAGAEAESSSVAAPISREAAMETCDETVYINADHVNVREMPDTDAAIVTQLDRGTELRRTGQGDSWSRVICQDAACYVASRYLSTEKPEEETIATAAPGGTEIALDSGWTYAGFAKITSGRALLYSSEAANRKGRVVCVNAGHGTSGGSSVKTQCHPDGSAKVTGGTTAAGATTAVAVSGGMTFADGTAESKVTLALAKALKEKLLARGYDVLMIRESDDVQLDNIARTVIANNVADCHLALHWDSTESDKGAFYMSVPDVSSYRGMEPVASHWQQHHALGESLIAGLKGAGVKIFSGGSMAMDLTQTSYSTIPSVDIELGDKVSDHSAAALEILAEGLADGVDIFFE